MSKQMPTVMEAIRAVEVLFHNTHIGGSITFGRKDKMAFGHFTEEMVSKVERYVKGKRVFDLGAGNMVLSQSMLDMGATVVYAVDKDLPKEPINNVIGFNCTYEKFIKEELSKLKPDVHDVALLSWPSNENKTPCLRELLEKFDTIVYLGKNTDMRSCGSPRMFLDMLSRKLLEHVPAYRNTMLVWGSKLKGPDREPVLEEMGGIDYSKVYTFNEKGL